MNKGKGLIEKCLRAGPVCVDWDVEHRAIGSDKDYDNDDKGDDESQPDLNG